jgi:hypothetical protein
MPDIRTNVAARIEPIDKTIVPDILSPNAMHDNIIRALDRITAPPEKGGHARKIIVTSAHSNHHDDGHLGEHGHNPGGRPGWAVDLVPRDNPELLNQTAAVEFIKELIVANRYVTKVGCPTKYAARKDLMDLANAHGVALFPDEGTGPHIHIQSQ